VAKGKDATGIDEQSACSCRGLPAGYLNLPVERNAT
jgi:hypothetical protein